MHIAALGYPDNPSIEQANMYKSFLTNFGNILPCKKCSANYVKHLREMPIDRALENRKSLFSWTVELHNIVNKHTGKPVWNADYAEAFYMSGAFNECRCDRNVMSAWRYLLILMIVINIIVIILVCKKVLLS
jgi:hypothetical protein